MNDTDPPEPTQLHWRQHAENARELVRVAMKQVELALDAAGPDEELSEAFEMLDDVTGHLQDATARVWP